MAEQSRKPDEKTHLCISFMNYSAGFYPILFSVRVLELEYLFSKPIHDVLDVLTLLKSAEDHPKRRGNGIAVSPTDGYLYVSAKSNNMHRYSLDDLRDSKIIPEDLMPMHKPKITPIVVAINRCIYVLSRHFSIGDGVVDLDAFEAYDLSTCQWKCLPVPPCMLPPTRYCYFGSIASYFVHDEYLCISTETHSFAFNTKTEIWDTCHLLSGEAFDHRSTLIYKDHLLYVCGGVSVYALKIDDGKVYGEPKEVVSEIWEPYDYGYYDMLIHLGGSKFCLAFRRGYTLDFAKIRIVENGNGDLRCEKDDIEFSTIDLCDAADTLGYPYQGVAF